MFGMATWREVHRGDTALESQSCGCAYTKPSKLPKLGQWSTTVIASSAEISRMMAVSCRSALRLDRISMKNLHRGRVRTTAPFHRGPCTARAARALCRVHGEVDLIVHVVEAPPQHELLGQALPQALIVLVLPRRVTRPRPANNNPNHQSHPREPPVPRATAPRATSTTQQPSTARTCPEYSTAA